MGIVIEDFERAHLLDRVYLPEEYMDEEMAKLVVEGARVMTNWEMPVKIMIKDEETIWNEILPF